MTTTDPKLIERASLIAEQAYSAGNLVTCDGYYEFDLDAAAAVVAAAINEAAQKERDRGQAEGFAAAVQWLRDRSASKPRASLWQAAEMLADQMEQSRIPAQAIEAKESQHGA